MPAKGAQSRFVTFPFDGVLVSLKFRKQRTRGGLGSLKGAVSAQKGLSRVRDQDEAVAGRNWRDQNCPCCGGHWFAPQANQWFQDEKWEGLSECVDLRSGAAEKVSEESELGGSCGDAGKQQSEGSKTTSHYGTWSKKLAYRSHSIFKQLKRS